MFLGYILYNILNTLFSNKYVCILNLIVFAFTYTYNRIQIYLCASSRYLHCHVHFVFLCVPFCMVKVLCACSLNFVNMFLLCEVHLIVILVWSALNRNTQWNSKDQLWGVFFILCSIQDQQFNSNDEKRAYLLAWM